MEVLLIAYDLRKPNFTEGDYEPLYSRLGALGARRVQESVWALRTSETPKEIFGRLKPLLSGRDRLIVAMIGDCENLGGINRIDEM